MENGIYEDRPYQAEAVAQILSSLQSGNNVFYQLPTGAGKTAVAILVSARWLDEIVLPILRYSRQHIFWMTNRRELIKQSGVKLSGAGLTFDAVVDTPMKMWNAIQQGKYKPGKQDLLIADEAHHGSAKTWERVIATWPGQVLGLSATPYRLSRTEGLDHLFDDLICGPSVRELQDIGALAKCRVAYPDGHIVDGKGTSAGDYSKKETYEDQDNRVVLIEGAVDWWFRVANYARTLVYAINTEHAHSLYEVALEHGIRTALVLGKTPEAERDLAIQMFRDGELDWLITIEVVAEGFDVPAVACVLMLRVTKSLALYLQMAGRVMRPYDNKEYGLIMDATTNTRRLGLPEWERVWSLLPRSKFKTKGEAPVRPCVNDECESLIHLASKTCKFCGAIQYGLCITCGMPVDVKHLKDGKIENIKERCRRCDIRVQHQIFEEGLGNITQWPGSAARRQDGEPPKAWIEGHDVETGDLLLLSSRTTGRQWRMYATKISHRTEVKDKDELYPKKLTLVEIGSIRKLKQETLPEFTIEPQQE